MALGASLDVDEEVDMVDVLFVAVMAALFGVTAVFVKVCDRIIGADRADAAETAAASAAPRPKAAA